MTDDTGSITSEQTYDSFGNGSDPAFPSRYQFTGREYDPTIGLRFSRARFYDPRLGRFISEDPIGFAGGDINLYGYVWSNPVMYSDPSGLSGKNKKKIPKKIPTSGTLPGTNIPYRMDLRQEPNPNMHVWWSSTDETVISHRGGWLLDHGGKPTVPPPMKYRPNLRPVVCEFVKRVRLQGTMGGVLSLVGISGGLVTDYEIYRDAGRNNTSFEAEMCEHYSDAGPYINTVIGMLPNPYQGCMIS